MTRLPARASTVGAHGSAVDGHRPRPTRAGIFALDAMREIVGSRPVAIADVPPSGEAANFQFDKRTSLEIGRSVMLAVPSSVRDWKPA